MIVKKMNYIFNVAGVTMNKRQATLKRLYSGLKRVCGDDDDDAYGAMLGRIKVKLVKENDNKHDKYAIAVHIWSRKSSKWMRIGYVPSKVKFENRTSLNEVVKTLIDTDRLASVKIDWLDKFSPSEDLDKIIYFCKIKITYAVV